METQGGRCNQLCMLLDWALEVSTIVGYFQFKKYLNGDGSQEGNAVYPKLILWDWIDQKMNKWKISKN